MIFNIHHFILENLTKPYIESVFLTRYYVIKLLRNNLIYYITKEEEKAIKG